MIGELLSANVLIGIAGSGIRLATPYLYAAIGETFGQRSGVLNLGVEGVMLVGAFSAFYTTYHSGSLILGVLVALIVGALMGLLAAFISVTLKAEQGISGIGIFLFGLGRGAAVPARVRAGGRARVRFPRIHPPAGEHPVIGEIFFNRISWSTWPSHSSRCRGS